MTAIQSSASPDVKNLPVTFSMTASTMQPSVMEQPETEQPQQAEQYIYQTPQPQYAEYQPYQSASPETITEIAEQITEEKTAKIKKALSSLEEFKAISLKKIEKIDERLKRIEDIIDKLQISILGKISSYGESIENIRDEMSIMQESFSKALPQLIGKPKKQEEPKEEKREKHKKSSAIEHYLRR